MRGYAWGWGFLTAELASSAAIGAGHAAACDSAPGGCAALELAAGNEQQLSLLHPCQRTLCAFYNLGLLCLCY
jgi:hypothetical protein